MHQHTKQIVNGGVPVDQASKVMIMIHGRGATAQSILPLAEALQVEDFALIAPQADQQTWYPYSFMAPPANNEPGLSSALEMLKEVVDDLLEAGFKKEDIYFIGFSQGACLAGEFAARNADRYGGVFILSGGLIGDQLYTENYAGDFAGTPVFLGCSDVDSHIPLHRVKESTKVFEEMGAKVVEKIYPNMPHTVVEDEILEVRKLLG